MAHVSEGVFDIIKEALSNHCEDVRIKFLLVLEFISCSSVVIYDSVSLFDGSVATRLAFSETETVKRYGITYPSNIKDFASIVNWEFQIAKMVTIVLGNLFCRMDTAVSIFDL